MLNYYFIQKSKVNRRSHPYHLYLYLIHGVYYLATQASTLTYPFYMDHMLALLLSIRS